MTTPGDFDYIKATIAEIATKNRTCLYTTMADMFFISTAIQTEVRGMLMTAAFGTLTAEMVIGCLYSINEYEPGVIGRALALAYTLTHDTYITGTTIVEVAQSLKAVIVGNTVIDKRADMLSNILDFVINEPTVQDAIRICISAPTAVIP
jgi:hypothetical protein